LAFTDIMIWIGEVTRYGMYGYKMDAWIDPVCEIR
jgi:hypothetical protein